MIALYYHNISNFGGAEKMICLIANRLAKKNIEVTLITLDKPESKNYYEIDSKIKWYKLGNKNKFLSKFKKIYKIYQILRKNKIKKLIGFVMSGDQTVFLSCLFASTKIIVAERNSPRMYWYKYNFFDRFKVFFNLLFANRIVVQFNDYIYSYPKFLVKKIISIPNPVFNHDFVSRVNHLNDNNEYNIICVSRLDNKQKQISLCIEAFSKVSNITKNWKLNIIGDGKDKKLLLDKIKYFNLNNKVNIINPSNKLKNIYMKSHLFIIPSLWEGFPNSLAEAMSYGIPSIGFKSCDGVNQLINDTNGWLVEGKNNAENLAKIMHIAITNSQTRHLKGLKAKEDIKKFNFDEILNLWTKLVINDEF